MACRVGRAGPELKAMQDILSNTDGKQWGCPSPDVGEEITVIALMGMGVTP